MSDDKMVKYSVELYVGLPVGGGDHGSWHTKVVEVEVPDYFSDEDVTDRAIAILSKRYTEQKCEFVFMGLYHLEGPTEELEEDEDAGD